MPLDPASRDKWRCDMVQIDYLFDPLCGWCYGAGPALEKLAGLDNVRLTLAPTGLFAGQGARAMDQHFAAYAALAFLPALHERRIFLAWAAAGLVALGVFLEFGQLFLSMGRFFELGDMAADAIGVCLGMAFGLPLRNALG